MKNYSRQRNAILSALRSTVTHPTALSIYETVKEDIPNISLATVYRNLNSLAQNGDIIIIPIEGQPEHYDGDFSSHMHFCCKNCGTILDIPGRSDLSDGIEQYLNCKILSSTVVFSGLCQQCKGEKI